MDPLQAAPDDYEIRIAGPLHPRWQTWFEGFRLMPDEGGGTILRGRVRDQSELHAVLAQVRDLGLTLLAVKRLESEDTLEDDIR